MKKKQKHLTKKDNNRETCLKGVKGEENFLPNSKNLVLIMN